MKLFFLGLLLSLTSFASLNVIIGDDDRKLSESPTGHDNIGILLIQDGHKERGCTGTLIGPRHVITAAHCLSGVDLNQDKIIFIPGINDYILNADKDRLGIHRAKKLRYLQTDYSRNSQDDIGVIILETVVNAQVLPLAISPKTGTFYLSGYPKDKAYGTLWEASGSRDYFDNGHSIDSVEGQSGSAIRTIIHGKFHVVGIHSSGKEGLFGSSNYASFFTHETLKLLNRWLMED